MEKETIKNIFNFIKENEGKRLFLWKWLNNEPLTDDDLIINDNFNLYHLNITSLPEGLKVIGSLNLGNTTITSLPKGLEVEKDLFITNTRLEKLSDEEIRDMIKPGFVGGKIYRI